MKNRNLVITSILGAITVILGAFGAHVLKEKLGIVAFKNFETAVKYQMYHVIVLLIVNTTNLITKKLKNTISIFLLIGILFFSGSLYLITVFDVNPKYIWFVTPMGGLCFIIGWLLMCFSLLKSK